MFGKNIYQRSLLGKCIVNTFLKAICFDQSNKLNKEKKNGYYINLTGLQRTSKAPNNKLVFIRQNLTKRLLQQ
jgi:hypothetical protein